MSLAIDNDIPLPIASRSSAGRYLVVDELPLVRDTLHALLERIEPGARTDLAVSEEQMRDALSHQARYRFAITDLHMGERHGMEVLRLIRELAPSLPVVVFSADGESGLALRCVNFGAVGFIPKTDYPDMVGHALRQVMAGQTYLPRRSLLQPRNDRYAPAGLGAGIHTAAPELNLTERQTEVLGLILDGMPNKLICRKLRLAEGTVKVHVSNVLRALGVRNRTQAVIAASRLGLRLPRRSAD